MSKGSVGGEPDPKISAMKCVVPSSNRQLPNIQGHPMGPLSGPKKMQRRRMPHIYSKSSISLLVIQTVDDFWKLMKENVIDILP